jgi:hypothetical protein
MAYVGGAAAPAVSTETAQELWITAGGNPAQAATAAAIAAAESSLVPNNWNTDDPSGGSFGLWQINGSHAAALAAAGLTNWQTDPLQNAQAAVMISQDGSNWSPWSTYTDGTYLRYVSGTVSAAVASVGSGYGSNPTSAAKSTPTAAQSTNAGTSGIFGPVIDAANTIATEVFLGALAIALLSGGILWLASTDSNVRAAASTVAKGAT